MRKLDKKVLISLAEAIEISSGIIYWHDSCCPVAQVYVFSVNTNRRKIEGSIAQEKTEAETVPGLRGRGAYTQQFSQRYCPPAGCPQMSIGNKNQEINIRITFSVRIPERVANTDEPYEWKQLEHSNEPLCLPVF